MEVLYCFISLVVGFVGGLVVMYLKYKKVSSKVGSITAKVDSVVNKVDEIKQVVNK